MAGSLRDITRKRPSGRRTLSIVRSIKDVDDRAAAIVLGSLVDTGLERVLKRRMRELTKSEYQDLFESGPLSSFSSRLKIAYALGLIGPKTRHDLGVVTRYGMCLLIRSTKFLLEIGLFGTSFPVSIFIAQFPSPLRTGPFGSNSSRSPACMELCCTL